METLRRVVLGVATLLACGLNGSATHIVGGEMSYLCLGNNNYQITLKVYRDCFLGQAPFDNPTYVFIYDGNGVQQTFLSIPFPGSDTLPNDANNPCIIIPPNICVEEAVFQWTVNLPPNATGYKIIYQRCCRNNSIVNIVNPGGTGATYEAVIPPAALATCNSSPYFNNYPPTVICTSYPFSFDHSATDPDGDSLVYELCAPYDGATSFNPYPFPPMAYGFVNFLPPYSATNPMGGLPSMSIDPVTGLLTVTPTTVGQFVVGVCVSEYRNGVFLSKKRRDFQFNVAACGLPAVAAIPSIANSCDDYTFTFPNYSTGASTYFWDFGVPNLTNDTSNLASPTYTYADTGTFTVTLIANPNSPCSDTATMTVYVYPTFTGGILAGTGCVNEPLHFFDNTQSTYGGINSWQWNFAGLGSSTLQNPTFAFTSPGTYQVWLIVQNSLGCADTVSTLVSVYEKPGAYATPDTMICYLDTIQLFGWGNGSFSWAPALGLDDATAQFPYASPDVATVYTLTVTNQWGCKDQDSVFIDVVQQIDLLVSNDTIICVGGTAQLSVSGGINYLWQPFTGLSDPVSAQPTATPSTSVLYQVTSSFGSCTDTAYVFVEVRPLPNIAAGPDQQVCVGDSVMIDACCATSYFWQPAQSLTANNIANPIAFPTTTTTYVLTAVDTNYCPVTIKDSLTVSVIYPLPLQSTPDTIIILGTSARLYAWGGVYYEWNPPLYLNDPYRADPTVTPLESITYFVFAITEDGCRLYDTIHITVQEDPLVLLPNAFTPNGDGINDLFKPIILGHFDLHEFKVFNRWGMLVFQSTQIGQGWDGTYGGLPEEMGTYVCYLKGESKTSNKSVFLKGNVILLR